VFDVCLFGWSRFFWPHTLIPRLVRGIRQLPMPTLIDNIFGDFNIALKDEKVKNWQTTPPPLVCGAGGRKAY